MRLPPLVLGIALALCASLTPAVADPVPDPGLTVAGPGTTVVPDWRMQTSAKAGLDGSLISSPRHGDRGWLTVPARSTVMAGLIANRRYPDLNYSTNLRDAVNPADFSVPWWYRREFLALPQPGRHTVLRLNGGVISRGELWLNGVRLGETAGAYPRAEFDLTGLLRPGHNALAIKAMPADPFRDFTVSFLDWSPPAPDNNMGIWRDISLVTSGAVSVAEPRVVTALEPDLSAARLTVKAAVRNHSDQPQRRTVSAAIGGDRLRQQVELAPGESTVVTFPELRVDRPRVWWPAQFGEQPLYRLTVSAGDSTASTDFGIRDVRSELTPQGQRKFLVNFKPFLVRGGGWASDLFLRAQPRRLAEELKHVRDLGVNTLRLEGKQEDHELLELADRFGIMLLPGWECCTKWEKYSTWTEEDYRIAGASTAAEAARLVNHPSILGFFIGSDNAATARVEQTYLDALRAADFTAPILPSAAAKSTPQLGKSGMKMDGPYWWIPPNYWYQDKLGGAAGFASEVGSGPMIPELASLRKFLTPQEIDDLWRLPTKPHYHLAKKEVFATLSLFADALAKRYGQPKDLADFLRKAQLANYEGNRAQFEAYGRDFADPANPATGVIYWMINNAWPTLYWHLWDHNLDAAGSYFGAKKALRPLHVQYSYDDRSVVLAGTGLVDVPGLKVRATATTVDGRVLAEQTVTATAPANSSARVLTLPEITGFKGTYLVRLLLERDGVEIDRNVYWLSTSADVLDFTRSTWWHTPVTGSADLTGLQDLPMTSVRHSAHRVPGGAEVRLHNTSGTVALAIKASLDGVRGPVRWSDNYVTLWPGESITLRAEYDGGGGLPPVRLGGFNVGG
ncbi:glycosyl hydrolase 2 galactose-binding domain-containing protein [Crossiella cryophila]|uniref:Exo-1,4-beta-D-glucosaminidase n=1 Tax=Crossiella cryophila TaxID=43355 RepID=A0A7W7C539_9PSEU|nr:sugar-binding domain-containing protein [Crossiella cryophila]MBB4674696.1 exo-1,4-beta-D-glucosaminidase [Crossiella cryophila]